MYLTLNQVELLKGRQNIQCFKTITEFMEGELFYVRLPSTYSFRSRGRSGAASSSQLSLEICHMFIWKDMIFMYSFWHNNK